MQTCSRAVVCPTDASRGDVGIAGRTLLAVDTTIASLARALSANRQTNGALRAVHVALARTALRRVVVAFRTLIAVRSGELRKAFANARLLRAVSGVLRRVAGAC